MPEEQKPAFYIVLPTIQVVLANEVPYGAEPACPMALSQTVFLLYSGMPSLTNLVNHGTRRLTV